MEQRQYNAKQYRSKDLTQGNGRGPIQKGFKGRICLHQQRDHNGHNGNTQAKSQQNGAAFPTYGTAVSQTVGKTLGSDSHLPKPQAEERAARVIEAAHAAGIAAILSCQKAKTQIVAQEQEAQHNKFYKAVVTACKGTGDHYAQRQDGQPIAIGLAAPAQQIPGTERNAQDGGHGKAQLKARCVYGIYQY